MCPFCAQSLRPLHAFDRATVAFCDACEVGRLDPMPSEDELAALSGSTASFESTDAVGETGQAADAPQLARTFQRKLRRLLRYGPVRDLLDVGCGTGRFMQEARRLGIAQVVGIDRNPLVVAAARTAGLEVYEGSVEVLPPGRQFDAIALLDVLQHIRDPLAFLHTLRPHLRAGGHLLIMTPNIRSLLARVSGRNWGAFKIPEHVYYYSPRSIRLLLERTGFDPVWVRGTGQYLTLASLFARLARIAPRCATVASGTARLLRLDGQVVYAPNGAMDVVARVGRASGALGRGSR